MEDCTYTIVGWDTIYENSRSRVIKSLDWVPVPNKHDGEGFNIVMNHPKSAEIYSAWHLILQVASKCPVRGVLVSKDGKPYNAESLSMKTRGKSAWFKVALEFLSSPEIGWLSFEPKNDEMTVARHHTVTMPSPSRQEGDTEGKGIEGNEGNGIESNPAEQKEDLTFDALIDQIKAEYPKRLGGSGWSPKVRDKIKAIPKKDWAVVIRGVVGYRCAMDKTETTGTKYVKHISTFFNEEAWREYSAPEFYNPKLPEPEEGIDYWVHDDSGILRRKEMDSTEGFNLKAWQNVKRVEMGMEPKP